MALHELFPVIVAVVGIGQPKAGKQVPDIKEHAPAKPAQGLPEKCSVVKAYGGVRQSLAKIAGVAEEEFELAPVLVDKNDDSRFLELF